MTDMYTAQIVADSISPDGTRITSVAVKYPHAVHKDMLRHRNQARVVESFRARPTELLIEALEAGDVFRPEVFSERVKGMGRGDALADQEKANMLWDNHIANGLFTAREMSKLNIAKEQVNFVLQDLCPLVEIITATDWNNYFALRLDLDENGSPRARPEVYKTALAIQDAMFGSTPRQLKYGEWHLPLVAEEEMVASFEDCASEFEEDDTWRYWARISSSRCARISYDKHRENEPLEASVARAAGLVGFGHMSPFDQSARPLTQDDMFNDIIAPKILIPATLMRDLVNAAQADPANFDATKIGARISEIFVGHLRGWVPYRKLIPNEHDYSLLLGAAQV